MSRKINDTRVTVTGVRLSYANVWKPKSINGSEEKYSVSLIIPKSDTQTLQLINEAIDSATENGTSKFGGKTPNKGVLKTPLRDGDIERENDEAYKNAYFINANSKEKPRIVDLQRRDITDESLVYSGCHANVSVTFYAYNASGNKGVACGLCNIQKVKDGEALSGSALTVYDDFEAEVDDDFLN